MNYDIIMEGLKNTALTREDLGDAVFYYVGYFDDYGDFNKYAEYENDFERAYKHFKTLQREGE